MTREEKIIKNAKAIEKWMSEYEKYYEKYLQKVREYNAGSSVSKISTKDGGRPPLPPPPPPPPIL